MSQANPHHAFVHLRVHTEFSIVDGLLTIRTLIRQLQKLAMPAIALTDRNNMFGLIKFYSTAESQGVKPLCGCDVTVMDEKGVGTSNVVLLVKNELGYKNLTELISSLYTERIAHREPMVSRASLFAHSEGLIALSGGRQGDIGRALLAGEEELATHLLAQWMQHFPDSFYLELQRTGRKGEEQYNQAAVALAEKQQCPVVATNDVCFLQEDDFEAHEVRVCINDRRILEDPRRPRNYSPQQYLRSASEMQELFADIPEALVNSVEIAKRCSLTLSLGVPYLPDYPVPEGLAIEKYFCEVSSKGLKVRLEALFDSQANDFDAISKPYWERLDVELGIINQMGFAGYFLIVMEFIQWARDNDIPVGPGRGSGAGSIVAYALKITDLDPLKYDLLFERFLNPERVSMPDFDVDFCMDGRDRVIAHVAELYGKEAVSQIITFGTMAARAVVKDVGRVQGKSYGLADRLSKLIPNEPGITLKKAFEQEPQLGQFVDSEPDAQEIMEMAYKLEGITRNVGKHAGGVVIAPSKLTDFTPLYCDENGDSLVTQFDKNDVETAGLVKFDFLGLRTLTIIDWAIKMIATRDDANNNQALDITKLPLDDAQVYRLLQAGETTAVFQLESRGMKDLIKRLKPGSFEDIIALVALFRPGPLQSGMVDDFIDRKKGLKVVAYPHPDLEPVLANTYGVILYQEQVMQIAQVLANYSLGGADILRKAMGKKKPEEMAKQRVLFLEGATSRNIDPELSGSIFDLMEKFAGYGFNKSHSAAYALLSYQTAWLKVHHPACFMAAVLTADMQNTDKIVTLIEECRSMSLRILPPDVNMGKFTFTVNASGEIVYGLGALKGLGEGAVEAIIATRDSTGAFVSLLDFCQRVDIANINKRSMEALIKAGAFDKLSDGGGIDHKRAFLIASVGEAIKAAEQSNRNQASGVDDLFGDIEPVIESHSHNGKVPINFKPWGEQQRLMAEKETLGLYFSGHPVDEFLPELTVLCSDRLANLKPLKRPQLVAGLLHDVRTLKSKSGETIAFLVLDDRSARFELSLFAGEYEKYRDVLLKDRILVVECMVTADDYRGGGLRGRGKKVQTLASVREERAHRIRLLLSAAQMGENFCAQLSDILKPFTAKRLKADQQSALRIHSPAMELAEAEPESDSVRTCPVIIDYERSDARGCIILGVDWQVVPGDELIQRLRGEFGKAKVVVDY